MSLQFSGTGPFLSSVENNTALPGLSSITEPFTMACWFKSDGSFVPETLMCLTSASEDPEYNLATIGLYYQQLQLTHGNSTYGVYTTVSDLSNFTINVWNHVCGVFSSTALRGLYVNGVAANSSAVEVGTGLDPFRYYSIGSLWYANIGNIQLHDDPCNGKIAMPCIWNTSLSSSDITALSQNVDPILIKPDNIKSLWDFNSNDATERNKPRFGSNLLYGGNNFSFSNDEPQILYKRRNRIFIPAINPINPKYFIKSGGKFYSWGA